MAELLAKSIQKHTFNKIIPNVYSTFGGLKYKAIKKPETAKGNAKSVWLNLIKDK